VYHIKREFYESHQCRIHPRILFEQNTSLAAVYLSNVLALACKESSWWQVRPLLKLFACMHANVKNIINSYELRA
jgi:hypothetical protein